MCIYHIMAYQICLVFHVYVYVCFNDYNNIKQSLYCASVHHYRNHFLKE